MAAQRLDQLGLRLWFYEASGKLLLEPRVDCDFCRQVRAAQVRCQAGTSAQAQRVCDEGKSEFATSPTGCCLLGVPVYQRRRLLGAAVACTPTFETPARDEFARMCGRSCLDRQAMAALCRQAARHSENEAPWLCQVVDWQVQDGQAREVSRQELANLSTNLANTYEELALLYRISGSIRVTQSPTEFFQNLCAELREVMQIQAAAAILYPRGAGGPAQVVCAGQLPLTGQQLAQVAACYLCPRLTGGGAAHAGTPAVESSATAGSSASAPGLQAGKAMIDNQFGQRNAHLGAKASQIHTLIAVPLGGAVAAGRKDGGAKPGAPGLGQAPQGQAEHWSSPLGAPALLGLLVGINKLPSDAIANPDPARPGPQFDSVDLKLISSIGGQAAAFLDNHRLYEDLQDLLMGMLHALTASIDAKDPYTSGHSHRVALLSRRLAGLCGFDDGRAGRVYLAGLLHDIGKIGIPEAVLRKAGRLTDDEFSSVKRHPEVGAAILGGMAQMQDVLPAILHHHERVDGRGYPRGLAGRDIPIEALMVGLADSFDAMSSSRTYRASLPLPAVMAELRRCAGTQFDSRLVELLLGLDLQALMAELRTAEGQRH